MPIQRFTKQDFEEHALPHRFVDSDAMPWCEVGLEAGQFIYVVWAGAHALIEVQSTVLADGLSDPNHATIRASLVDVKRKSLGTKVSRWVHRTARWGDRTLQVLRKLAFLGIRVRPCPRCASDRNLRRSKDGRYNLICFPCNLSEWLDVCEPLEAPHRPPMIKWMGFVRSPIRLGRKSRKSVAGKPFFLPLFLKEESTQWTTLRY